jgi:hypothetical protein
VAFARRLIRALGALRYATGERMDVNFRLKSIHELILISLHILEKAKYDELRIAVCLLHSTEYDYLALLKTVVEDEAYKRRSFLPLGQPFFKLEEIISDDEFKAGVEGVILLGLVSKIRPYTLTDEGKRIAERILEGRKPVIRPPKSERSTIFVASSFGHNDVDLLFESEFKPACNAFGYTPFRVDLSEPSWTITESIVRGIQETECLLADLTYARPSVYFEIGLAHGLGIQSVLTCRQDHYRGTKDNERVHFDLEQYKISYWTRTENQKFYWVKGMSPAERLGSILKSKTD